MNFSDRLLEDKTSLKSFCNDLATHYPEDDIRVDFFGLLYDIFDNYYKGYIASELAGHFQNKNLVVNPEFSKANAEHLKAFIQVATVPGFNTSFVSNLNRRLIIDTWSTFELSINLVAESILDEETVNRLLDFESREIFEILKKEKIENQKTFENIKKRFGRGHLTHVPINRKARKIFDHIKDCYKRNPEEDEKFLIFYGKLRNTMHANFIYFGKDSEYTFKDNLFEFRNNKIITYQNKFGKSVDLYVSLFNEIKDIFYNIVICINPKNPILYPDTGIYWNE